MVYYIKAAANVPEQGKELMSHVYQCCLKGNPVDKHIFSSGSAAHIQRDIHFKPFEELKMGYFHMNQRLEQMSCSELDINYLVKKYNSNNYCSLIRFEADSSIHTILSFSFNTQEDCIEVNTFCCNGIGGGTIFNFLINAVNCGIDRCIPESEYERKIILSSLPEAEDFYKKYGFTYKKTQYGLDVLEKHIKPPPVISAVIPINNQTKIEQITKRFNEYYDLRPYPRKKYPKDLLGKAGDYAITHDDPVSDPTYVPEEGPRKRTKHGGTKNKRYNKKSKRHISKKRKNRQTKYKFTRKS
jgi:hypothetical protein